MHASHDAYSRVQEVFHTPDHYYMVMDLYTGGDMYARYKFRSEDETAKIVNKLINALRYCHDRNVAVRADPGRAARSHSQSLGIVGK